uniref:Peptidase_M1 domain-containing protein n=1 Tax=Heligmosomoides polygyrus TaxID=6339 RepID=A0A183GDG0_HELPZ
LTIKTYLPFYVDFPPEKNLTFDGQVEISMLTLGSIKSIVLNAVDITVVPEKCEVTVNQEKVGIESVVEHGELDEVEFVLDNNIPKDKEVVLKHFRIAAVSQMEPRDARRMVPCFDEPKFKANWTVTVIHPKGTRAVSNGIEKNGEGEVSGDWIISKFETTPRMSSYLLAVLISEFEYIEGFTKRESSRGIHFQFRIWSRPEAKAMTAYALQAGIKCLEFYEQYFDIKFPLPKQAARILMTRLVVLMGCCHLILFGVACILDMVALPDFPVNGMENWGLITYREDSLPYDDRYYAPSDKRFVALVIAHELASQWFGNLVTLKSWNDLWLNEGFATFVEYLGTDEISDKHMRM